MCKRTFGVEDIKVGTKIHPRQLYGIHARDIVSGVVSRLDSNLISGFSNYAVVTFTRIDESEFDAKFYLHHLINNHCVIED